MVLSTPTFSQDNYYVLPAHRHITDSEMAYNRASSSFNTLVRVCGTFSVEDLEDYDSRYDYTDDVHTRAASIGSKIHLLGGLDGNVVSCRVVFTPDLQTQCIVSRSFAFIMSLNSASSFKHSSDS